MKELVIKGEADLPYVVFNTRNEQFQMGGSSIPENVMDVFDPIIEWLDGYAEEPNPQTRVEFFFDYLNTASSKMMMRIVEKLNLIVERGNDIHVDWCYLADDYDMRDLGTELLEESFCTYDLIERDSLARPI